MKDHDNHDLEELGAARPEIPDELIDELLQGARSASEITGQGGMSISGTFYVAGGPIKITGSSTSTLDVIGSQYISRTLQSGGSGSYTVDWDAENTAPLRQLALVE